MLWYAGMNDLMSFPHLITWIPLEAVLLMRVTGAAGADPVGGAELTLAVILLIINDIGLGFDFLDSYKWLKGERDIPRPPGHKAS